MNPTLDDRSPELKQLLDALDRMLHGDFSPRLPGDWNGIAAKLAGAFNELAGLEDALAAQLQRLSREVGKDGRIGQRADPGPFRGGWAGMVESMNGLVDELVRPTREMARVVAAVGKGDLTQAAELEPGGQPLKGEFLTAARTVNSMVGLLAAFASEVTRVAREVGTEGKLGGQASVPGAEGMWKDLTDNVNRLAANLTTQVRAISEVAISVTQGDLTRSISLDAQGEVMGLKDTINQMIANLRVTSQKDADQVWLKTNLARFALMLQGQSNLKAVSAAILAELSTVVGAQHGVFYIADAPNGMAPRLKMLSAFAYQPRSDLALEFGLGEGLVGQCARDKRPILVTDPPADYIKISSGLGEGRPASIIVLPILFDRQLKAVLELASFGGFTPSHLAFLEQLMEAIGIALNTLEANLHTQGLVQSLQFQQEELRKTNQALEDKADQLALTSKYKSEFLSNMSHELRTPLNSMLILSQQLAEDRGGLSDKQVEYARTIHASGGDLLSLINDILDLSKVESGTLTLELEDVAFTELRMRLDRLFRHVADRKGLGFSVDLETQGLDHLRTDGKRLEQILRNLLSNAFKFTDRGGVTLAVGVARDGWAPEHPVLSRAASVLAFTVTDSGIGIPLDKQRMIFEAFQQADGGTSRKYGGTGLGLSISRELAGLLGCQLSLAHSTQGQGSSFVLYVPSAYSPPGGRALEGAAAAAAMPGPWKTAPAMSAVVADLQDDRRNIVPGDVVLLIVEDNPAFAGVLLEGAHQNGFKGVVALDGRSAVDLAAQWKPDAITLDIRLPDMDGWGVLSRFKNDLAIRHVPVQVIAADDDPLPSIRAGAMAFLAKPVSHAELSEALQALKALRSRAVKELLVLCAKDARGEALTRLLAGPDVELSLVNSAPAALRALQKGHYDCMVMDFPGLESQAVLQALERDMAWARLPIVAHFVGDLDEEDRGRFEQAARKVPVTAVKSMDRLLDDTALHLHRVLARMAPDKRSVIENLYQWAPLLAGKKALVVDDDIRNIYALTSLLETYQMKVLSAESGSGALELLALNPDIDVVLMDIMMPKMDGYEAIRAIRRDARFASLPIIAVTAKAMKGDREKCLDAGASGYITKPVDSQHLLALMRQWLRR